MSARAETASGQIVKTRSAPITIVGGGINGLMCAYALVRAGHRVTLYERNTLPNPYGASYGKHRLIHPWTTPVSAQSFARAVEALGLWHEMLTTINCQAFFKTGVLAVDATGDGEALARLHHVAYARGVAAAAQLPSPFAGTAHLQDAIVFRDFGVLLAANIVESLLRYLRACGVVFIENASVEQVDPKAQELSVTISGRLKRVRYTQAILATGTGAGTLMATSPQLEPYAVRFQPRRCYVAYVTGVTPDVRTTGASWAMLNTRDLWGMSEVGGIAMKIGCGAVTRDVVTRDGVTRDGVTRDGALTDSDDAHAGAQQTLANYQAVFPGFAEVRLLGYGYNHWTRIDSSGLSGSDQPYLDLDGTIIVTSDNGFGFKFAPYVARAITEAIVRP